MAAHVAGNNARTYRGFRPVAYRGCDLGGRSKAQSGRHELHPRALGRGAGECLGPRRAHLHFGRCAEGSSPKGFGSIGSMPVVPLVPWLLSTTVAGRGFRGSWLRGLIGLAGRCRSIGSWCGRWRRRWTAMRWRVRQPREMRAARLGPRRRPAHPPWFQRLLERLGLIVSLFPGWGRVRSSLPFSLRTRSDASDPLAEGVLAPALCVVAQDLVSGVVEGDVVVVCESVLRSLVMRDGCF